MHRAAALLAIGLLAGSTTACGTGSHKPGVVTGAVPFCYGPGPDLNLTPEVTIYVRQHGGLVTQGQFHSDENHPKPYRISLSPGTYSLTSSVDRKPIVVRVRSGGTTHADLPSPGCT